MIWIVEIHDTENDKVGVLTDSETGEISQFDSYSKARVQSVLIKDQLTENMTTKVVSIASSEET